jgi:hypothetical protein
MISVMSGVLAGRRAEISNAVFSRVNADFACAESVA